LQIWSTASPRDGPPGTGEKLMAHFKSVLFETEEIDPTAPLDCKF